MSEAKQHLAAAFEKFVDNARVAIAKVSNQEAEVATKGTLSLVEMLLNALISWKSEDSSNIARRSSALTNALTALDRARLFVPARISREDIGDAQELLHELATKRAPTWMLYTKVTSALFWIALNAVREWTQSFLGKDRQKPKELPEAPHKTAGE